MDFPPLKKTFFQKKTFLIQTSEFSREQKFARELFLAFGPQLRAARICTSFGTQKTRAENGGLDLSWLGWGTPIFRPEVPKPFKISVLGPPG